MLFIFCIIKLRIYRYFSPNICSVVMLLNSIDNIKLVLLIFIENYLPSLLITIISLSLLFFNGICSDDEELLC